MKLYRLSISPSEAAGEGEDIDEWFTSLRAAKKRRRKLIRDNPTGENERYLTSFRIDLITISDKGLTRKQLALLLLNHHFISNTVCVVGPYEFDRAEATRQVMARLEAENITSTPIRKAQGP